MRGIYGEGWRGTTRTDAEPRMIDGWQVGRAENTTGYLSSSFLLLSSPLIVDQDSLSPVTSDAWGPGNENATPWRPFRRSVQTAARHPTAGREDPSQGSKGHQGQKGGGGHDVKLVRLPHRDGNALFFRRVVATPASCRYLQSAHAAAPANRPPRGTPSHHSIKLSRRNAAPPPRLLANNATLPA